MTATLDTNVLYGAIDRTDAHHDAAREVLLAVDRGEIGPVHISDYVIAESLSLAHSRLGHDVAVGLLDRVNDNSNIEVIHSPKQDYHGSIEVFLEYTDLSFIDASIVAHMERTGIGTLYSFDTDFDAVDGVHRAEAV